jgi:hypothetical protein
MLLMELIQASNHRQVPPVITIPTTSTRRAVPPGRRPPGRRAFLRLAVSAHTHL